MKNLKTLPSIILLLLVPMIASVANDDKYLAAMQKNITAIYEAKTVDEFQALSNTFHRIGEAEKTKWEPYYYEAYGYIMMANTEKEPGKKDAYLDSALKAISLAKAVKADESEIVALEGFVHMIRVTIDPASRGQQYSSLAFERFNEAVAMNPENPRALILQAQMEFGTARFFGSSTDEACGSVDKALAKFESASPANPLAPHWGKGMAVRLKESCKK